MTKTPTSRRRGVRFANEAERLINTDTSIEDARDEEDSLEARSPSISAESSKEMITASKASSPGVA